MQIMDICGNGYVCETVRNVSKIQYRFAAVAANGIKIIDSIKTITPITPPFDIMNRK